MAFDPPKSPVLRPYRPASHPWPVAIANRLAVAVGAGNGTTRDGTTRLRPATQAPRPAFSPIYL